MRSPPRHPAAWGGRTESAAFKDAEGRPCAAWLGWLTSDKLGRRVIGVGTISRE